MKSEHERLKAKILAAKKDKMSSLEFRLGIRQVTNLVDEYDRVLIEAEKLRNQITELENNNNTEQQTFYVDMDGGRFEDED